MAFENLKSSGIAYVLTKLKDYFLLIRDAVKSVNGELPDEDGDILIKTVPYAQNLESEYSHSNYAPFIQRTSGGEGSVSNGDAWLMNVKGTNRHDGYVAESIAWELTPVAREDPITATFNRDTFVDYVAYSGTITLAYSSGWTADPALYGFTITGTPVDGDVITVVYQEEIRGEIIVSNPLCLIATGWNLYDDSVGYAKVVKYANGYRIDGSYTDVKYAATLTGTKTSVTVIDGNFDIVADGYIFVTGGDPTDTAVYPTWEDWTEGPGKEFEAYTQSMVDFSSIMSAYFPNGLLKAGSAVDEINFNLARAISRVERLNYNATNLAIAKSTGREYEYDEDYIYLARSAADIAENTHVISVSGDYTVDDHGIEYFTQTELAPDCQVLYGTNLKNKLERDVLTISQQTLTSAQQTQVRQNISAVGQSDITSSALKIAPFETKLYEGVTTGYVSDNILKFGGEVLNSTNFVNGNFLIVLNGSYANVHGSMYLLILGSSNSDHGLWMIASSDSTRPEIAFTTSGSPYVKWSTSSGNIYADIFRLR